jgi:hypothetical protein
MYLQGPKFVPLVISLHKNVFQAFQGKLAAFVTNNIISQPRKEQIGLMELQISSNGGIYNIAFERPHAPTPNQE